MRMVYGILCSIYAVHDEAKDKAFELEMSWICDESNREHLRVSTLLLNEMQKSVEDICMCYIYMLCIYNM